MASSTDERAAANSKHCRVLLPFTLDSLRIPVEFAEGIVAVEALIVGPTSGGAKAWNVEVGWDSDGAFLGSGWPEFAGACGVEAGWHLILQHRGRGVLTVKAFDASDCLREKDLIGASPVLPAVEGIESSKYQKPQFIRVLHGEFHEKLLIPPMFVHKYIRDEHLNNHTATVFGPHENVFHIELQKNCSDVFFIGGWSHFLVFNNITESDVLLFIYEGKMEFTVRVFNPEGYQREEKDKYDTEEQLAQQEAPSASIQKHCKNNRPSCDGGKKQKGLLTPLNKEPVYKIGQQSVMKKQINANTLKELALAKHFCDAIGLNGRLSTITIKNTTRLSNTESWQVHAVPCMNMNYRLLKGWGKFCSDNSLKLGDICTFKVMETKLWHVIINHLSHEIPSASSRKRNMMNSESSSKGQKRPKSALTSMNMASARRCVYEIGPPAWIKKEINSSTVENRLYLPPVFCKAIGIQEPCKIRLASMSSTRSWQVRVAPYEGSSYHVSGPGWKQFCMENEIKVGDVCTINITEKRLWHVTISSPTQ